MLVTVVLNTLLAIPVFGAPQACCGPSLAVDPVELRRRRQAPRASRAARPAGPGDLMYLDDDRRPTLTPQLALRVAIIGGVALVAFAVIFFRLWYLQVLSGDKYLAEARDNRVREIKVQAPRGEIVDREGRVLVDNRTGHGGEDHARQAARGRGRAAQRLYRRLGKLLGMRPRAIERDVETQLKRAAVLHRRP